MFAITITTTNVLLKMEQSKQTPAITTKIPTDGEVFTDKVKVKRKEISNNAAMLFYSDSRFKHFRR